VSGPESTNISGPWVHLGDVLEPGELLTDPAARLVYARDASHLTLGSPLAVALPTREDQVAAVVAICRESGVPVVCRGTGTGLSGGAVPPDGALVLGTGRLTRLDAVDVPGRRVRVGPGVLNDAVSRHAKGQGLHFAPDPSSQAAASIGGNIAENAGGPHCLRHGVTLRHLLHLDWVDARGRRLRTGRGTAAERGLDLVSLLCGSEGTLGVVTGADLNLVPNPVAVSTLLGFFPDLEDGTRAVIGLLGDGLAPVAVEMVDQAMLAAVEQAFAFGFPSDVEAAMIVEFAGPPQEVAEDGARAARLLEQHGAREVRLAAGAEERAELWKCRKKAFGAVGRLAPNYVTMDVVVPLGELPGLVREIQAIKKDHGVEVATAFHAGDGNLHPGVHYDDRDPDQGRRAHAAADAIIRAALARGGSITGEHGVGIEKIHALPWQLDAETARLAREVKNLFDPTEILNPGKMNPPADAAFAPLKTLPAAIDFQWENLTVSAPSNASVAGIQRAALARGFWIPVGVLASADESTLGLGLGGTVGDLVNHLVAGPAFCAAGTARDFLLELWAETGDGKMFHAGAPVFKNVAGYDLAHMLCGSGGIFARPRAATFQLRPVPPSVGCWRFSLPPGGDRASALAGLLEYLSVREDSLGGPVAIVDIPAGPGPGQVTVLIPGRDRDWDLGQAERDLMVLLDSAELVSRRSGPFAGAAEYLSEELIPRWALQSPNWTALARQPGGDPEAWLRSRETPRFIWQSSPRLVWTPNPKDRASGFHADHFSRDGVINTAGPPGPGVPVDYLRAIKSLFDPEDRLGTPPWLGVDHG